jgi:cytochrome P450
MITAGVGGAVVDVFDIAHRSDPYPAYRRLRETPGPAPFMLGKNQVMVLSRYADCAAVLQSADWGHGHADRLSPFWNQEVSLPGSFIRMDPPDHRRLRNLVNKAFSARMVADLAPMIDSLVSDLVDRALAAGRIDVVRDVSTPLALAMVGRRLLGVPERDGERLRAWELAIVRGTDPDDLLLPDEVSSRDEAVAHVVGYLSGLAEQRRREPADDLLSRLVAVEESGDGLTNAEVIGICVLLLIAGMETSINLIGNGMIALLRNPEQLALLRAQPDLVPAAVEEMLRYDTPTQFTMRVALADTVVGGRPYRRGDGVIVLLGSASRDEEAFADGERFDVTRYTQSGNAPRHLGFGLGMHYCLGSPLARMEAAAVFRTLLARAGELSLTGAEPAYQTSRVHRGLASLPITLSAAGTP